MTALDDFFAVRHAAGGGKLSAAQMLVAIADFAKLFRDADGDTAFATFEVREHRETWPVRSKAFKRWLIGHFYKNEAKPPPAQALADALGVIEARAQYESPVHPVHVRVAGDDDAIYVDLVNDAWQAVEVTAAGWRIVNDPPVKFRRARGMLSLPTPERGGFFAMLRGFVNVADDDQWGLLLAWLVAAARPRGPYPVLALLGEQGSAKSTTERILRALIDPNVAPVRSEPRDPRDVMIAASNAWCIAFDNLSDIEPWFSDCLCRLATGGGFSTRELYSDGDEVIFHSQRPVMLNGIEAVISRADLLDRALIIDLPRIPESSRRREDDLWGQFDEERGLIFGALLDAVAVALKRQEDVRLARLPRMADFAVWATAAEPGLRLPDGAFLKAYAGNRADAHALALEASPVAAHVRTLAEREYWHGTAAELLVELVKIAGFDPAKRTSWPRGWPTSPRALSAALRRIAPNLRAVGVDVTSEKREARTGRRLISVKATDSIVTSVTTVTPGSGDDAGDGRVTEAPSGKSASDKAGDAGDDGDGQIPLPSWVTDAGDDGDEGRDCGDALR
jgi:hypothetical protein